MVLFFKYPTFLKYTLLVLAIVSSLTLAHATPTALSLSVPFQNIILNPNNIIQASYVFGPNAIIFCYENNLQSIGSVTWPYHGKSFSSTLSVPLTTNANYQGLFADPTGIITIINNQSTTLVVNCVFGF